MQKFLRSIYNMNPTITDDMNRWFEVECQTMMVSGPIWLITQVQAAHGNHGNNQEHKYCLTRYSQFIIQNMATMNQSLWLEEIGAS